MIETSGHMTAETGTYRWMAPEVIEHKPYDEKADVFSFGVVMWELLTCKVCGGAASCDVPRAVFSNVEFTSWQHATMFNPAFPWCIVLSTWTHVCAAAL